MGGSETQSILQNKVRRVTSQHYVLYYINHYVPEKKKSPCVANILNIPTKPTPLYSPPSSPLKKPKSISLAPLLVELPYLAMLFIIQLTLTSSRARRVNNTCKEANLSDYGAKEVGSGLFNNRYGGEHNAFFVGTELFVGVFSLLD